jgi:hypothetical protein
MRLNTVYLTFSHFFSFRVLLRGTASSNQESSCLENSPAKSLSGNQWCQLSSTTFLEEKERGEHFALGRSAVSPLGATYNQNYSIADNQDRYSKELRSTTTTTTTEEAIKPIENVHNLEHNHVFEDRKMGSGQPYDYYNDVPTARSIQSINQDNNVMMQVPSTIRPPLIGDCPSNYSSTKQWNNDRIARTSMMDEELSFMMERYLESSGTRVHDSVPVFGTVQPSPGQQSTDSGFASDTPQQSLMSYPEQLLPEQVGTGFQTGYDPSFYSGFGQYYEQGTSHCPNPHNGQQFFEQTQHSTTSRSNQQPWENDSYNNEDLSQIVDQVLNSIDAQFCDITSGSNNAWTGSADSLPVPSTSPEEDSATKNVNGKIELCDNCGNLVTEPEEPCRNCGHLLQRNLDSDITR